VDYKNTRYIPKRRTPKGRRDPFQDILENNPFEDSELLDERHPADREENDQ